jgi:mannosyltransferase
MLPKATLGDWLQSRKVILLLLLIIAAGSFLRVYGLGTESIWLDEVFTAIISNESFVSAIVKGWQPPYFAILQPWVSLFGNSEASLRAPSAILGILSILVIYLIGCALFNRKVGLISSLLSAISLFHIQYSQEARGYTLILLLALLSYLFFIQILKQDKKWYYPCYLLANIFLVYTNPINLFVIATQIFYLLLFWTKNNPQRFKLIGVQAATLVASLPVVLWILGGFVLPSGGIWAHDPSLMTIYETLRSFAGNERLILIFLPLAIIAPLSFRKTKVKWDSRKPLESLKSITWDIRLEAVNEIILLLLWLAVPIAAAYIVSKIFTPMYLNRYLIASSPALYLLVAKGLSNLKAKQVIYPVLFVILLLAARNLVNYYGHVNKEQWRELAKLVELNAQKNDVLIFCPDFSQVSFDYYYQGKLEKFVIDRYVKDTQEIAVAADEAVSGKERLWLILSHVPSHSPVETYLIDRYGRDSVLLEPHFFGIHVLLFDLTEGESKGTQ